MASAGCSKRENLPFIHFRWTVLLSDLSRETTKVVCPWLNARSATAQRVAKGPLWDLAAGAHSDCGLETGRSNYTPPHVLERRSTFTLTVCSSSSFSLQYGITSICHSFSTLENKFIVEGVGMKRHRDVLRLDLIQVGSIPDRFLRQPVLQ